MINPYETPKQSAEEAVMKAVEISSEEMVNTKKVAVFSKALLWGNVGAFSILIVWILVDLTVLFALDNDKMPNEWTSLFVTLSL